ncbi:MAG: tetratricopeptide repeat protein [Deltaproteobacteria bacterium]|nr:tetratricopeptide repeat protein [Deltaproteobacteria bacterium]
MLLALALLLALDPVVTPPLDAAVPRHQAAMSAGDRLLFDGADDRATYSAAIKSYDDAIAAGDAPALVWARKAEACLRLGDVESESDTKLKLYKRGQAAADAGIAKDPRCDACWFWRGGTLGRWGQTRGILDSLFLIGDVKGAFTQALAIDPANHDAVLSLALVDQNVPGFAGGSVERAEAAMRKVLSTSPHFTRAMLDLAELLGERGEKEEARRWATKALNEQSPLHPGGHRKFDLKRAKALLAKWA